MDRVPVRRALISVYDKSGVVAFARGLSEAGCEIISSGGTAAELRSAGLTVTDVSDLTGFPEMLDGRVKTLHPRVHAGILADRSKEEHLGTLAAHNIPTVDLVVVNLYPFDTKVADTTPDAEAVELIDVGGPTMVRAGAKNFASVAVITDPGDYPMVGVEVRAGGTTLETRRRLAAKAFARLASYDAAVAAWMGGEEALPERFVASGERLQVLRYGENPHQEAAVYRLGGAPHGIASGHLVHGAKALSYINYLDLDAAYRIVSSFEEPAACVIKHTNPCGVGQADAIAEAYVRAFECDTRSAFGGIVGLNRECDRETAERMVEIFIECVVAPGYTDDALDVLRAKKNLRLIDLPADRWAADRVEVRSITGGLLLQTPDPSVDPREAMKVVSKRTPSDAEWDDLVFAWTVCSHVKSNAIVLANLRQAVGVGAGQMSRVEAMEIAIRRAGDRAKGCVAASDAFFPFPDSVEIAAGAGVTAIVQPGGSMKDEESIAAADAADVAMVFTGTRHFRH